MVEYLSLLIHDVPYDVCLLLLAILCISTLLLISYLGVRNGSRYVMAIMLVEYVFLLFCSTVLFREDYGKGQYNYLPFWSYVEIYYGDKLLLPQIIMNVMVFIPVGFLLSAFANSMRWWKVMLTGFMISSSIEVMQFLFRRGFSELDDIFHNTIGCLIGLILWAIVKKCIDNDGREKLHV